MNVSIPLVLQVVPIHDPAIKALIPQLSPMKPLQEEKEEGEEQNKGDVSELIGGEEGTPFGGVSSGTQGVVVISSCTNCEVRNWKIFHTECDNSN